MQPARAVTVTGLAETIRSIRGLMRYEVQQQLSREMGFIAEPIALAARANIMQQGIIRSGALFDSLVTVPKVNPNRGTISVIIGPKKQRAVKSETTGRTKSKAAVYRVGNKFVMPAKYAHLVELGTRAHAYQIRTRKGIVTKMHPGARGKPFLGPAFRMAEGGLIEAIGAAAGAVVEAQARQAAK